LVGRIDVFREMVLFRTALLTLVAPLGVDEVLLQCSNLKFQCNIELTKAANGRREEKRREVVVVVSLQSLDETLRGFGFFFCFFFFRYQR
jgi:hypothetical protein